MKAKFFSMSLLCMLIASSCNSDRFSDTEMLSRDNSVEYVDNPYTLDENEIADLAMSFFSTSDVVLRSGKNGKNLSQSVKTKDFDVRNNKMSKEKGKEVKQKVPVYTVNYTDEAGKASGFVVIAGDERIQDKELIFNETADFDISKRDDAAFIEDLIAGYLYNNINGLQTKKEVNTRLRIVTDYGNTEVIGIPYSISLGQYVDPYNRYTPFRNGKRSPAGPEAVAMAEIMAYHDWPQKGAFKRYTTNTTTPETVSVSYVLTSAERQALINNNKMYEYQDLIYSYPNVLEYIANLLIETGYKLNSNYGMDITSANPMQVQTVFAQMGYTTDAIKEYDLASIKAELTVERPVFMTAWSSAYDTYYGLQPYSYVIPSFNNDLTGVKPSWICVIHGAWGDSYYQDPITGYYQNWFNSEMFSKTTESDYQEDPKNITYPYRFQCRIITNIKPNFSNSGSTDPNWRVSSMFSY